MPRSAKEIVEQADELARRFEEYEPDPSDRRNAESLAALHRAAMTWARAEATLTEAVHQARGDGHSWAIIGRRLGTSGEAARQRYNRSSHVQ